MCSVNKYMYAVDILFAYVYEGLLTQIYLSTNQKIPQGVFLLLSRMLLYSHRTNK